MKIQYCTECRHFMLELTFDAKEQQLYYGKCKVSPKPNTNFVYRAKQEYAFCSTVKKEPTCEFFQEVSMLGPAT